MKFLMRFAALAAAAIALVSSVAGTAAEWKPERNIEFVVGTAPGSRQDRTARLVQKIWQDSKLLPVTQAVINRPGGGGEIGWAYFARFPGDAHYVAMVSPAMISNQLLGKSKQTFADVTPLALLNAGYTTFSVKAEHSLKSMDDLVQRLKKDPASVSFGFGTSIGNALHVTGALYGHALGLDARKMKMVVFNASAEAMTSVMGGHVDVLITSFSTIISPVGNNQMRVLGAASPSRNSAFPDVPTFRESGVDLVFSNWNGMVGTKGLTEQQIAYWDRVLASTTATPEWKATMARDHQEAIYLPSHEMKKHMEKEREQYRASLTRLGLVK